MTYFETAGDVPLGYEVVGEGAPVVFVGGALNGIETGVPLGELMEDGIKTLVYDRRGRGTSPDAGEWSIDAEVEDLHRMMSLAAQGTGQRPNLFANCSGGMLALRYLERYGEETGKVVLYEPPYMEADIDLRITAEVEQEVGRLVDDGNPDEAVCQFLLRSVGFPPEKVELLKSSGKLAGLRHLSPSLKYEIFVAERNVIPEGVAASVRNQVLIFVGSESQDWQHASLARLRDLIPEADLVTKDGCNHVLPPDEIWQEVKDFILVA